MSSADGTSKSDCPVILLDIEGTTTSISFVKVHGVKKITWHLSDDRDDDERIYLYLACTGFNQHRLALVAMLQILV